MLTDLQKRVFTNRALGKTFMQISAICKITPGNAYNIFTQATDTLQTDIRKGEEAQKILDCLHFIYVDETDYAVWKYPMRLSLPHLIFSKTTINTARELFGNEYKIFSFNKLPTYGRRARVEDMIVHTLRFDHTAAKIISERNRGFVDKDYLKTRIKDEDMKKEAVMVSFDLDYGFDLKTDSVLRYIKFDFSHNMPLRIGL